MRRRSLSSKQENRRESRYKNNFKSQI